MIVVNFAQRIVLIVGTQDAGEIKKSIFTVLNYLLPQRGVQSMHRSATEPQATFSACFGAPLGDLRACTCRSDIS